MGKFEIHFQMGVVERVGYSLLSAILIFNSVCWYQGKHQKLMTIASECVVWWSVEKSLLSVYKTPIFDNR